ncbi:MAG: uroporphyrinogen decarboxylase family protein [Promethearchaeota archaeon]|jgi:uroporphyrinogen decarboxylase
MNAPERILTTIEHEEPDRVPAFESAFTNNTILRHYGTEAKGGRGYKLMYNFFRKVGIDLVLSYVSSYPRKFLKAGKGFIDEYGKIMRFERYKDGTQIMAYHGGYFKSFEDYESWEQPDPNLKLRLDQFMNGRKVQHDLNDEVFSIPATGSLMECTWEGFGIETFSRILSRSKQIKKVFDDRGKFTLELVKILAEKDAQMVLLWDDYGFKNGLFMRPSLYQKYIFPWIKQICDAAHKKDCKILLHSDGDLTEIFEDIINSGVDAINPVESTTANPEYDIFKLNEKFGDKITFAGNLSPIMLSMGEISEIEENAKRLIRELAPGGGYIFGSGHSINPAVSIDRFEAMQNIRRKYGVYPIKVPI